MHGLCDIKCMNMEGFSVKQAGLWIIRQIRITRKKHIGLKLAGPTIGKKEEDCYLLSMHWFSLEEERVIQQSSVSIYLGFITEGNTYLYCTTSSSPLSGNPNASHK